jgi:acyl carrier protein
MSMTRQDALRLLEKTLELSPHTLTGGETLRNLEGWDSLSTMTIIAMADKEFGLPLPGGQVARCQTVDELLALFRIISANRAA